MKRKELNELKANISEKKTRATDLDIIVAEVMKLPRGQLKKVLTDEVMAVLAKYGYTEE
jgi:hypothetical protein